METKIDAGIENSKNMMAIIDLSSQLLTISSQSSDVHEEEARGELEGVILSHLLRFESLVRSIHPTLDRIRIPNVEDMIFLALDQTLELLPNSIPIKEQIYRVFPLLFTHVCTTSSSSSYRTLSLLRRSIDDLPLTMSQRLGGDPSQEESKDGLTATEEILVGLILKTIQSLCESTTNNIVEATGENTNDHQMPLFSYILTSLIACFKNETFSRDTRLESLRAFQRILVAFFMVDDRRPLDHHGELRRLLAGILPGTFSILFHMITGDSKLGSKIIAQSILVVKEMFFVLFAETAVPAVDDHDKDDVDQLTQQLQVLMTNSKNIDKTVAHVSPVNTTEEKETSTSVSPLEQQPLSLEWMDTTCQHLQLMIGQIFRTLARYRNTTASTTNSWRMFAALGQLMHCILIDCCATSESKDRMPMNLILTCTEGCVMFGTTVRVFGNHFHFHLPREIQSQFIRIIERMKADQCPTEFWRTAICPQLRQRIQYLVEKNAHKSTENKDGDDILVFQQISGLILILNEQGKVVLEWFGLQLLHQWCHLLETNDDELIVPTHEGSSWSPFRHFSFIHLRNEHSQEMVSHVLFQFFQLHPHFVLDQLFLSTIQQSLKAELEVDQRKSSKVGENIGGSGSSSCTISLCFLFLIREMKKEHYFCPRIDKQNNSSNDDDDDDAKERAEIFEFGIQQLIQIFHFNIKNNTMPLQRKTCGLVIQCLGEWIAAAVPEKSHKSRPCSTSFLYSLLYPLLEKVGAVGQRHSKFEAQAAEYCLDQLSNYSGYDDVASLLVDHLDIILDQLILHFQRLEQFPTSPDVVQGLLSLVVKQSCANSKLTNDKDVVLSLLEDMIQPVLHNIDSYVYSSTEMSFRLFQILVMIMETLEHRFFDNHSKSKQQQQQQQQRASSSPESTGQPLVSSQPQLPLALEQLIHELNILYPEENQEEEENYEGEPNLKGESKTKPPLHKPEQRRQEIVMKIIEEILHRCSYYSTIPHRPTIRCQALKLMYSGFQCLFRMADDSQVCQEEEDAFNVLPIIHQLWPTLARRLTDEHKSCIVMSLKVVELIASHERDFIIDRFQESIWPVVELNLTTITRTRDRSTGRHSLTDQSLTSESDHRWLIQQPHVPAHAAHAVTDWSTSGTLTFQLQLQLLKTISSITCPAHSNHSSAGPISWSIAKACAPFLASNTTSSASANHHEQLAKEAKSIFQHLIEQNAGQVFVILVHLLHSHELVRSYPQRRCYEDEFPHSLALVKPCLELFHQGGYS